MNVKDIILYLLNNYENSENIDGGFYISKDGIVTLDEFIGISDNKSVSALNHDSKAKFIDMLNN